ncbi:DUF4270 family protein [Bacteroides sp.]
MRRLVFFFSFSLYLLILFSCRDEMSTAGGKWVESALRNIRTDTCTVTLSTILSDSLATSGDSICQIGRHNSSFWGDIQGTFYTEYDVSALSVDEEANYQFDSITCRLYVSGNYLGDTLSGPQRIYLHQLTENLELSNSYLYTTSSVPYDPTPLTSFSFTPHPGQPNEAISFRLPDELGKEWLNLLQTDDDKMSSQEKFRLYFKGLAFVPDAAGTCINGFQVNDSSLCIRLHYHKITESSVEQSLTFTPSSTLRFTRIEYNRSNTVLSELQSGTDNALPSGKTDHQAYLQGMTGLYVKIEFPHLNNLLWEGDMVSIESATLQLYPVKGTHGDLYPLPETLVLYTANENDVTEDVVTDLLGTSVQDGSLVTDEMDPETTYYSFDITSFLQSNLGAIGYNRKNLKLMLPDDLFFTTVKGVVFGDMQHETSPVKLVLMYKVY